MKKILTTLALVVGLYGVVYALTVASAPFNKVVAFKLGPGESMTITRTYKVKTAVKTETLFTYTASTTGSLEGYAALHGIEK